MRIARKLLKYWDTIHCLAYRSISRTVRLSGDILIGFWESGLLHNSCSPPQSFSQLSWAERLSNTFKRIPTSKPHIGNPDRSLVLSHAVLNFHHMCILRRFNSNSAPTIREKKIHWWCGGGWHCLALYCTTRQGRYVTMLNQSPKLLNTERRDVLLCRCMINGGVELSVGQLFLWGGWGL